MKSMCAESVPKLSRVILSEEEIQLGVNRLAKEITRDYKNKNPMVVGVLTGALFFTCDLIRRIETPLELDFMSLRHFNPKTPDSSHVEITKDLENSIEGREVLIVEDLVDTGLSLHYLCQVLGQRRPASMGICSLLARPKLRLVDLPLRYRGFSIDEQFLVGYGLDFQGYFRNLSYLASLKEKSKASRVA